MGITDEGSQPKVLYHPYSTGAEGGARNPKNQMPPDDLRLALFTGWANTFLQLTNTIFFTLYKIIFSCYKKQPTFVNETVIRVSEM